MVGQCREFMSRIRGWGPLEHGLDLTQRDEIGKAPIGCGRMRVVGNRQPEVTDRHSPRHFNHILATSHQLDNHQRQVGETDRIAIALAPKKGPERT